MSAGILTAASSACELSDAIREIAPQIRQDNLCLVILFFSSGYRTADFTAALTEHLPDVLVAGCSTAGEINERGYQQNSLCALSFSSDYFSVSYAFYETLSELNLKEWYDTSLGLHSQHNTRYQLVDDRRTFSLLFTDGLCRKEEPLVRMIANAIAGIPLIGGSAGDNGHFEQTFVLHNHQLYSDCALQLLITTTLPFTLFKSQNIRAAEQRMVVTEALPEQRTIIEINGLPAATEYARHLGLDDPHQLTDELLAAHPVVVVMGDDAYVRSIQKVNDDLSLTFYCAIDTGIVIRVGKSFDLMTSLQDSLDQARKKVNRIQTTLMFDCIMRRIELDEKALLQEASGILQAYHPVGFSTYGEQWNGLHVNQTCTGLVLGYPDAEAPYKEGQ